MDTIETDAADPAEAVSLPEAESHGGVTVAERVENQADTERRLRDELARVREQARSAVAERDAAVTTLQAENRDRLIRSDVQLRAMQQGIVDLDGLRLMDLSAVSVSPDGSVVGADEALAAFQASKPYLFDRARSTLRSATTTALQTPPPRAEPEAVDARRLTREQWQTERARLLSRRS